jgi:hypothetical protein
MGVQKDFKGEMLRYVGNPSQIFGIKEYTLIKGSLPFANVSYTYSYILKYEIGLPANSNVIILPDRNRIKIFVMSVAKKDTNDIKLLQPLSDDFYQNGPCGLNTSFFKQFKVVKNRNFVLHKKLSQHCSRLYFGYVSVSKRPG